MTFSKKFGVLDLPAETKAWSNVDLCLGQIVIVFALLYMFRPSFVLKPNEHGYSCVSFLKLCIISILIPVVTLGLCSDF